MWQLLIGKAVDVITGFFKSRAEKQNTERALKARIELAKANGDTALELTNKEWELVKASNENGSWKDEYVTLLVTAPLALLLLAIGVDSWAGDTAFSTRVINTIQAMATGLEIDLGGLMTIVVLAAVSLKGIDRLRGK
jgi:hypothetical protein